MAAGVTDDGKAAHGLRKVAACRAAEAEATESELNAMFCWAPESGEAGHYIRLANAAKLARSGGAKIYRLSQPLDKTQ